MFELLFELCLKGGQCSANVTSKRRCFQKNCTQMHHTKLHYYFIKRKAGDDVGEENVKVSIFQT